MSGGLWNYEDQKDDNYNFGNIEIIINGIKEVLHKIDWAESGDTNRKDAEPLVYNLMLKLGNELFSNENKEKEEF